MSLKKRSWLSNLMLLTSLLILVFGFVFNPNAIVEGQGGQASSIRFGTALPSCVAATNNQIFVLTSSSAGQPATLWLCQNPAWVAIGSVAPTYTSVGTTTGQAGGFLFGQGTTSGTQQYCYQGVCVNAIGMQAPAAVTANYTMTLPGTGAPGIILNANSANVLTESFSGDANHVVLQSSKTALVTTFTVCAATAGTACGQSGQYRISYNFWGSGTACSVVTVGSVGLNFTWTDEQGTTHTTVSAPMYDQKAGSTGILFNFNTALGTESANGEMIVSTNGTIIQAATTYTACSTGTGTYNLRIAVEELQ